MSTDLDRLFARLAERVDAVPPPALSAVRARAAQRSRRSLGGLLAAGAAVIGALLGAQAVFAPSSAPPPPPPTGGTAFVAFDGDADPVVRLTGPVRFGMVATVGDRSYAMWMAEDGTEWVSGVDLVGRTPLWPALSLGKFGDTNGMEVSTGALLLLTEQGFDNPLIEAGADTVIAVDPDTGKIMWTLPYSFNDTDRALFDDTLVVTWHQQGRTQGLDLRTGTVRWTVGERVVVGGTSPVRTLGEHYQTGGVLAPSAGAGTVALHLADGRVQLRDVATGRVERELSMPLLPPDTPLGRQEVVVDGVLHQFVGDTAVRLPLDGSAPATEVALRTDLGGSWPQPCGVDRFCAVVNGADAARLVVVDTLAGGTVWQREVDPAARAVLPHAAGLLVAGGRSELFDLDGNPLAALDGQALWVESGDLLVIGESGVAGFHPATGARVELGRPPVAGYCSWNATMLTCPTQDGIGVYRYAE